MSEQQKGTLPESDVASTLPLAHVFNLGLHISVDDDFPGQGVSTLESINYLMSSYSTSSFISFSDTRFRILMKIIRALQKEKRGKEKETLVVQYKGIILLILPSHHGDVMIRGMVTLFYSVLWKETVVIGRPWFWMERRKKALHEKQVTEP